MNKAQYAMNAARLAARPPNAEHPEGQKFRIGETVKIVNPQSWFAKDYVGRLFTIEYSYHQKYPEFSDGDRDKRTYSLASLGGGLKTSWFNEDELELADDPILSADTVD